MDDQGRAADASREAFYDWWEEGDMRSTHHVVHGTRDGIKALRGLLAAEQKKSEAVLALCDHCEAVGTPLSIAGVRAALAQGKP